MTHEERSNPSNALPARLRLFVYGSLKRGFRHHDQLSRPARGAAAFVHAVTTAEGYRLVRYHGYPALTRVEGGRAHAASGHGRVVHGELYEIDAALLVELDRFEDYPALYQRADVVLSDASAALAYVIDPKAARALPEIADGVWIG